MYGNAIMSLVGTLEATLFKNINTDKIIAKTFYKTLSVGVFLFLKGICFKKQKFPHSSFTRFRIQ